MPIAVLIDYDGTISLQDIGDWLMHRHVPDTDAIARMDARYVAGEVGSRDMLRWEMDVLPRDPGLLRADAATIAQDEGMIELARLCATQGIALEVVSDGLGFYIASNLERMGLGSVPIYTNRNPIEGGAGMSFPFGHATCLACGTCKRERVRTHQAAGRVVVFVGDGPSDRYAAWHADVTLAKGKLRDWCAASGLAHQPWDRLQDVVDWLATALESGVLPTDDGAVSRWRSERPVRAPAFICGPEVAAGRDDESAMVRRSILAGAVDPLT
jgi:2,3-diketo-5-methylthio-1-phosphopentane phosphatase